MKIQFTQFAPDPSLRGTTKTLPAHRAQPLIDSGVAVQVPWKDFRERLAAEATSQTAGSFQNVSVDEEWGIDTSLTQFRQVVIIRKRGSETIIYDSPTKNTPPSIVKQFNDAVGAIQTPAQAEWAAEVREQDKNRQILQEQAEKIGMAKYRRT